MTSLRELRVVAARPLARFALSVAASVVLLVGSTAAASDGRVVAWGGLAPPPSVNGIDGTASAIAAGNSHGCAIQAGTGAVVCWGGGWGVETPPPSVNGTEGTATAIAAGAGHSCAIQAGTGAVVCWGISELQPNGYGLTTPPPSVNGTNGTATAIAAGLSVDCAIQAGTGAVVCWGSNNYGQATPPPSVNGTVGTAIAIAAGTWHACAIQAGTGAVVCWGSNVSGKATPPATAIAAGAEHSCAIQAGTNAVVCWGSTNWAPASVDGTAGTASAIASSSSNAYGTCAIQVGTDGVVCWGFGRLLPPASVDGTAGRANAIAIDGFRLAIQARECSDGLDADGDGLVDYPADPGCDSPTDVFEKDPALVCDDGLDNDADSEVDYPADPGCDSPTDASERGPAFVCDDGLDNDGDRFADVPDDPGCDSSSDESENSPRLVCDDGIDNEGDGRVDYPDDLNCLSGVDHSEDPEQCDDGIDNDSNGLVDYPADPSCTDLNDFSERVALVFERVADLDSPQTTLTVGGDGNIYGTSTGFISPGTAFRIDGAGVFSTIHTFSGGSPARLVVGQDGALYGFTNQAPGPGSDSEFFRMDSQGYTSLAALPTLQSDLVVGGDGAFYSALANSHCGFTLCNPLGVLKITSAGSYTVLGGDLGPSAPAIPLAVGSDGAVYGVRPERSISLTNILSIIRWDVSGQDTVVRTFTVEDEYAVDGFSLGGDGKLIRFDTAGNVTVFTVGSDGAMYGIGNGGVFKVDSTGALSVVHSFEEADGYNDQPLLFLARDGGLYGVNSGYMSNLVVFHIDDAGVFTPFSLSAPGLYTVSPLVQGSDCALYGVAGRYNPTVMQYETTVYRVFEPGQLCQRIDFAPLPNRTLRDPAFTVSAMASSGLPVSFNASGRCKLRGDQVFLKRGVGVCRVTASQAGDSRFAPAADVVQEFRVWPPGGMRRQPHPFESSARAYCRFGDQPCSHAHARDQ